MQKGQKIHASVAFMQGYTPKASMPNDISVVWEDILTSGNRLTFRWAKDILQMDLYDLEGVSKLVDEIRANPESGDLIARLSFMALTRTYSLLWLLQELNDFKRGFR